MAVTRDKINKALTIQETIEGKTADTDLLRYFASKITTANQWNDFVTYDYYRTGKRSYDVQTFYYPTDELRELLKGFPVKEEKNQDGE